MLKTIEQICSYCNEKYQKSLNEYNKCIRHGYVNNYCSIECYIKAHHKQVTVNCLHCNTEFSRRISQIKKSSKHFCSQSCAATYNNTHKTTGSRRSKIETFLENKLRETFPDLEIVCNSKSEIGSELDFYFPELKLAIEINGIFHYEPIFGPDKLIQIQNNDKAKLRACDEKGIDLIVIACTHKYLKEKEKNDYLSRIIDIIRCRTIK